MSLRKDHLGRNNDYPFHRRIKGVSKRICNHVLRMLLKNKPKKKKMNEIRKLHFNEICLLLDVKGWRRDLSRGVIIIDALECK